MNAKEKLAKIQAILNDSEKRNQPTEAFPVLIDTGTRNQLYVRKPQAPSVRGTSGYVGMWASLEITGPRDVTFPGTILLSERDIDVLITALKRLKRRPE